MFSKLHDCCQDRSRQQYYQFCQVKKTLCLLIMAGVAGEEDGRLKAAV
jgi:hypothetical protein